jgi:serine/threonine protein kinase
MIARGGMAEVYRAKTRQANQQLGPLIGDRLLAIKCMRPQLAKESRFVEMFIREGKLAVLLENDSIVRTFEIGRIEGRYFIAMEYIGGKDLTQILRRCQESNQRIPVPHACYIAGRMSQGLHYAHTRTDAEGRALNIVNRDVSPSNVRISYEGDVKLLDFGIAQAMLKFTSEIGVLKGKFSYMSPEQIRGMPVDARTDVFSTGIILHEMLTTEKLFRGDTEFALMEKVRKAEVPPPSKFNRRVPEALDKIVMKALARDLPDRYQSARELGDDLVAFTAQYRFKPEEMQEFMRNLFRQDYQKEAEEVTACHAATLSGDQDDEISLESSLVVAEPTPPLGTQNPPVSSGAQSGGGASSGRTTGPQRAIAPGAKAPPPKGERGEFDAADSTPQNPVGSSSDTTRPSPTGPDGGGFFSRLRKKFSK